MAKSFLVGLMSILIVAIVWLVPSLDWCAIALELPEDLQDLLNQAATDFNFPYPIPTDEDAVHQTPEKLDQPLDRRASLKAPSIEAPSPAPEGQRVAPSPQHPD
jgi:hypothetical protein